MKKAFKIIGWILLSLFGLLIILFLLARFAFRQQTVDYLNRAEQKQRSGLLRAAGPYVADTVQFRFTYVQDSVRAREIRNYFRLDTLFRPGASTWDNTLSLGKFVSRHILHNNQKIQPGKRNAIALWEYHQEVEPAFNCRLHSIMLHELLLASGITGRFVTCLPADSLDTDCHVVNMVWLPEQQKWAMIDSDMQAYITDPAGTPLSLEEMRRCYIADEPMEIHRLHDNEDTSYYRAYWAKNLYWFVCWEEAGYDKETAMQKGEGRSIYLIPEGFEAFELRDPAVITTDADRFWAAPENNL